MRRQAAVEGGGPLRWNFPTRRTMRGDGSDVLANIAAHVPRSSVRHTGSDRQCGALTRWTLRCPVRTEFAQARAAAARGGSGTVQQHARARDEDNGDEARRERGPRVVSCRQYCAERCTTWLPTVLSEPPLARVWLADLCMSMGALSFKTVFVGEPPPRGLWIAQPAHDVFVDAALRSLPTHVAMRPFEQRTLVALQWAERGGLAEACETVRALRRDVPLDVFMAFEAHLDVQYPPRTPRGTPMDLLLHAGALVSLMARISWRSGSAYAGGQNTWETASADKRMDGTHESEEHNADYDAHACTRAERAEGTWWIDPRGAVALQQSHLLRFVSGTGNHHPLPLRVDVGAYANRVGRGRWTVWVVRPTGPYCVRVELARPALHDGRAPSATSSLLSPTALTHDQVMAAARTRVDALFSRWASEWPDVSRAHRAVFSPIVIRGNALRTDPESAAGVVHPLLVE